MVARYKKKRLAEEWSHDAPPKHINLEGSERQRGKREANQGLKDNDDQMIDLAKLKADDEENYRLDWECYMKQQADPNYVCMCFKKRCESNE